MNETTVKLKGETKLMLDLIKKYENQSYDEVIRGLVEERLEEHLELRPEIKKQILARADEIRKVKTLSAEELYEKLYGEG